jgi:tRNA 2-thiouridine synthesizing protein B
MALHTLNKMHPSLWRSCLQSLRTGDCVLLLEEAVYAAVSQEQRDNIVASLPPDVQLFVLQEDLALRGISARIHCEFSRISYQDFVALSLNHAQVVNWH